MPTFPNMPSALSDSTSYRTRDILPSLIASNTARASFLAVRNFLLHWSFLAVVGANEMILPTVLPRSDTSTGSLETPDAPRSLRTRNQSSVQHNPTGFTHPWLHALRQSFRVQRPTHCQGSYRSQILEAPAMPDFYSQSGQWLADTIL